MNTSALDLSLPLLVVDDNQQMRSVVKGILADLGFAQVYLAGSGEEACRILKEKPIAAVISDLDMPGMDGLELLAWVRSYLAERELPFMLLPSEANRDALQAATAAGVTDCLIKPFTLATFHSKLQALLQSRRSAAPARAVPPAPAPAPAALIGLERPLDEQLKEATVLVVDDIANNIKVIAGMLADEGYGVKVAISGRKALEIIPVHRPDLILLDVMMPEMDGFEVCRRLKADPATADIPVIFLSAKDQADDIVGGLELGAVDFVTKPVDPAILKARMRTHLRLAGMVAELKRQHGTVAGNAQLREEMERLTRYDLNAPLADVLAASGQLLAQPALDQAQRAAVQALDVAARQALRVASLSLELCRLEQGASHPQREPLMLNELLARVAADSVASHPLTLPSAPMPALGDRALCLALFEHLIGNAVAHTPAGTALAVSAATDGGHCQLTLDYAGPLPSTQLACLLRAQAQRPDDAGALPIYAARLLAEVQGGALSAQDDASRSRLVLRLPAA